MNLHSHIQISSKRILITGASGLLGKYLLQKIPENMQIFAITHKNKLTRNIKNIKFITVDLTIYNELKSLIYKLKPEIIIHAAGISDVDFCQFHKRRAWKINCISSRNLIDLSQEIKSLFVFISSNAVFSGTKPPYNEESYVNPLNYYGETKVYIENYISENVNRNMFLITRLMTMYGWNDIFARKNPVTKFLDNFKQKNNLYIVDDIFNNYLYALDAAWAVWKLITHKKSGIYHIAGSEVLSRFHLALAIAEVFHFSKDKITPVKSSFFKTLAPRARNTSFDISKSAFEINFHPKKIFEGLIHMKKNKDRNTL